MSAFYSRYFLLVVYVILMRTSFVSLFSREGFSQGLFKGLVETVQGVFRMRSCFETLGIANRCSVYSLVGFVGAHYLDRSGFLRVTAFVVIGSYL